MRTSFEFSAFILKNKTVLKNKKLFHFKEIIFNFSALKYIYFDCLSPSKISALPLLE
jgi:hypothetical protein